MASTSAKILFATVLAVPAVWSTGMLDAAPALPAGTVGGLLLAALFFAGYALPTLVAGARHHHNRTAIGVLNLLLGWTLIGWVVALVWACTDPAPTQRAV